jgi:hypothetical protein
MEWYGLDSSGSGWVPVKASCEYGIESSGSMNCQDVLE